MPKEQRKRLKEQTKFMVFDAEEEVNSRALKDGAEQVEVCSSGVSMRSSQADMEKQLQLSHVKEEASGFLGLTAKVDVSELQDYHTILSKISLNGQKEPER